MTRRRVIKQDSGEPGFFGLLKRPILRLQICTPYSHVRRPKKSAESQTLAVRLECPLWVKSRHVCSARAHVRQEPKADISD